jgi:N6-L-threonylcarbamoyladenine synthase
MLNTFASTVPNSTSPCYILAIESSCDDTGCAILHNDKVLVNLLASQKIHQQWGGVVPELASREHQKHIVPLVDAAIRQAGIDKKQLSAVAFTSGPGLIGSLMVGVSFAKNLAWALGIPIIEVNHMQAHILAHFIDEPKPDFPFLCLTVSGGHTLITKMTDYFESEVLGQTLDDAAGEAFDKAAKILGLPYPGGPLVDEYAKNGDSQKYHFPMPSIQQFDYSFSGLKTSFLYFLEKQLKDDPNFVTNNIADICASMQQAIINHLLAKYKKAVKQTGIRQVAISGGVAANSKLRQEVMAWAQKDGLKVFIPQLGYCTDNAAMIGVTAYFKYLQNDFAPLSVAPFARG